MGSPFHNHTSSFCPNIATILSSQLDYHNQTALKTPFLFIAFFKIMQHMLSILDRGLWHDKRTMPSILTLLGIRAFIPHSPYWNSLQVRPHTKHIFMNLKTYKQMQELNNSITNAET